jgi:hypothetical protein
MQTIFPEATGASGLFLTGFRRANEPSFAPNAAEQLGVVIAKRQYERVGSQLISSDTNKDIKLQDEFTELEFDGETVQVNFYESDLAVVKPEPDIVYLAAPMGNMTYRLKHQDESNVQRTWLSRTVPSTATDNIDADAAEHVFGWQPKGTAPRKDLADFSIAPPNPAPDTPNLSTFQNAFFNGYRREFAQANYAQQNLQQDQQIIITELSDAADEDTEVERFRFTLPDPPPEGFLYYYKGSNKDELPQWKITRIQNFALDTVVIGENETDIYLVWRGYWPFQSMPSERYRQLLVRQAFTEGAT